jgi:hypothetical protein
MKETPSATTTSHDAGCFVDYDARVNLGKHRVVCGFSWLLRVIDHKAVLMDPKLALGNRGQVKRRVHARTTTSQLKFLGGHI